MGQNMLGVKKFFTKKRLTVLIACVTIVGLLIAAMCSGLLNKLIICPTCDGTGLYHSDTCITCDGAGKHIGSFFALLPAIIAIGLALITKEVFSSLFTGIISGSLLAAFATNSTFGGTLKGTIDIAVKEGLISAVSSTAGIFVFLIELGIIVCIINRAGGSKAFGEWAKTHIKSKVGASLCTFFLGILIFIDDYFNCLTVGSVMRPVTDKHNISRSKLAYLIDATAAPICMIAPISSWAAAVNQYVAGGDGFKFFIMAIPFNFYSILTLVFVVALTLFKFDFGPMKRHELNAMNGDLFSGKQIKDTNEQSVSRGRVFDLVIPIVVLIATCILSLFITGIDADHKTLIGAIGNTDATVALPWGGLIALAFLIIYMGARKLVSFKESMNSIPKGFIAMVPAILILTFATALKNVTGLLGAAFYVGDLMKGAAAGLFNFLPAIIFLVACLLSFATGTSWGTFGILIPIVTAMFTPDNPIMIISMSACLAGAVCGDHCSPISDTTIMSSAGAECEHLNHVSTQLPYCIFVAAVSFVCFVIAGFVKIWYIMLPLSIVIMIGSVFAMKLISSKLAKKKA